MQNATEDTVETTKKDKAETNMEGARKAAGESEENRDRSEDDDRLEESHSYMTFPALAIAGLMGAATLALFSLFMPRLMFNHDTAPSKE